jgi:hypothetical protein
MSDERSERQEETSESATDQSPAGTELPEPRVSINSEDRSEKQRQ